MLYTDRLKVMDMSPLRISISGLKLVIYSFLKNAQTYYSFTTYTLIPLHVENEQFYWFSLPVQIAWWVACLVDASLVHLSAGLHNFHVFWLICLICLISTLRSVSFWPFAGMIQPFICRVTYIQPYCVSEFLEFGFTKLTFQAYYASKMLM